MIAAVKTPAQQARFLAAAQQHAATHAQMTMRLAAFGDLPGSGWQFYTTEQAEEQGASPLPAALALRGGSATAVGAFEPEELGGFLTFLRVGCLTMLTKTPPVGYCPKNELYVYTLGAGQSLTVPTLTGNMASQTDVLELLRAPSPMAVLPLLFGHGEDAEDTELQQQYYADQCIARNLGMAELWLLRQNQSQRTGQSSRDIFTLSASAIVEGHVYLSAGETLEECRGQGVGGHYIIQMANEYAARGYEVCFVCEAQRCHFYDRLGFARSGVLYQYMPQE